MTSENSADLTSESNSEIQAKAETESGIGFGATRDNETADADAHAETRRPKPVQTSGSHAAVPDPAKRVDIGLAAPVDIGLANPSPNDTGSRPALRKPTSSGSDRSGRSAPGAERQDPLVGQTLFEDYVIAGAVGGGLASTTYEAKWISQDRIVAIKTTKHLQSAITSEFSKAAEAHLTLGHRNIVGSLGLMETALKRPFYVMEFIDAISLQDVIDSSGSLDDEEEIAEVVLQLCEALEFAHEKGVIHGDLKCSNVMLAEVNEQIELKILDFGFYKVTETIEILNGSRSPDEEPVSFDDLKKKDILALAVMIYEMVTGESGQKLAPDGTLMQRQKLVEANPNVLAPDALDDVLDEAMEPDLDWRFDDISDFRKAFEEWLGKARQEHTGATGAFPRVDVSKIDQLASHQSLGAEDSVGVNSFGAPTPHPQVQPHDSGLMGQFPNGDPADGSHPTDGSQSSNGIASAPVVRTRRKRDSKLAKREIFNVQQLKNTQAREEESLEMHLTQVFKVQGPRVSPAKTITRLTMKIVASIAMLLLSMTFIILNWDKLGQAWIETSTRLSAAMRGEEQQANFDDIDTRPPEEVNPSEKKKKKPTTKVANGTTNGVATANGSVSGGAPSGTNNSTVSGSGTNSGATIPASLPKPQQRFHYEEHPVYKDWVLKDVGAKRRIDGPRK